MTPRILMRSSLLLAVSIATTVSALFAGCSETPRSPAASNVDLAKLDVGNYATAPRNISDQPSLPQGTILEGIRMADAVADSSQFDSLLLYLWQADPVPETAKLVPLLGEAGKQVLDQYGWAAAYRASYADRPQLENRAAPSVYIGISIMLLRFPDETAARGAASALETTSWKDFGKTVAVPLPKHPEVAARYTPGTGVLLAAAAIGQFVVHLMLEAPAIGIETQVGTLDPVLDAEHALLRDFRPTPVQDIPALPVDPDRLLARMVTTDPANQPPVSSTFAVYGPTGALRDQPPKFRKDKLFEKWGVDRLAVSGDQHLYRLRDHQAAMDMMAAFIDDSSPREHEIEADKNVPDERCFEANTPVPDARNFACRIVFNNFYTQVRADTAISAKQKAAAQYALLAANP
jgi:hypothetical protein